MVETLKALQLLHRTLIAACIAFILLMASADTSMGPYEAALNEFRTIQRVMPELRKSRVRDDDEWYKSTSLMPALAQSAQSRRVDIRQIEFVGAEHDPNNGPPAYAQNSPQPINELYSYVKLAPIFDTFSTYTFEDSALPKIQTLFLSANFASVSTIYVSPLQGKNLKPIMGFCSVAFVGRDKNGNEAQADSDNSGTLLRCTLGSNRIHQGAVDLLRKNHLFTESDRYFHPFPAMTVVWDDISGKDMSVVDGILVRKAAAEETSRVNTVAVAGLTISTRLVGWFGPLFIIGLMSFLLAHLVLIRSILVTDPRSVRTFPDTGLFLSTTGRIALVGSLFLLPMLAGLSVIWRTPHDPRMRYLLCGAFAVALTVLSSMCFLLLWRITGTLQADQLGAAQAAPELALKPESH